LASSRGSIAQTKVVELDRGLFVLRYSASAARPAPTVAVACEHGSERAAVVISPPGYPAGILSRPGDALVVQAKQRAQLSVQVRPSVPNGSTEADVSIERLGQQAEADQDEDIATADEDVATVETREESRSEQTNALEVLAHVARLGDVSALAGEWIAGPESPARIEGLALKWRDASPHPDLKYAVRAGGRNSALMWGNGSGSFVGTRGQARPLTEIRFELGGPAAENSELVIEALFQGATPMRAEGRNIRLTGPTGQEALLGLRVEVVEGTAQDEVSVVTSASSRREANRETKRAGGRVRVFRSTPQVQRR
jgi:hypothetical protein